MARSMVRLEGGGFGEEHQGPAGRRGVGRGRSRRGCCWGRWVEQVAAAGQHRVRRRRRLAHRTRHERALRHRGRVDHLGRRLVGDQRAVAPVVERAAGHRKQRPRVIEHLAVRHRVLGRRTVGDQQRVQRLDARVGLLGPPRRTRGDQDRAGDDQGSAGDRGRGQVRELLLGHALAGDAIPAQDTQHRAGRHHEPAGPLADRADERGGRRGVWQPCHGRFLPLMLRFIHRRTCWVDESPSTAPRASITPKASNTPKAERQPWR